MVADELTLATRRIMEAREPEDVFGVEGDDRDARRAAAKRAYRRLARIVHPDAHGDAEAFRALEALWRRAQVRLDADEYGRGVATVRVRTRRAEYFVGARRHAGEVADLLECSHGGRASRMLFKAARHPRDNDLIRAEAGTLRYLHRSLDERWHPFLPGYVDHVEVRAGGGVRRRANVLDALDGFYTLEQVMEAHPFGIDPRDMAWIWRRLLAILGAVHRAGRVHGAVFPDHVMVHPDKHGLVLVDWGYAVEPGQRPRAVSRVYRSWYPAETLTERRLDASSDIYTGAVTALALLGPRVADLPVPLRAFFRACKLDARLRPDDAWDLQSAFDDVLERCYGRRRFRPFHMPEVA